MDTKSEKYGYVTTTPKEGWRDFNLLATIFNGIKHKKPGMSVVFDTDVNMVAQFEFEHGDHTDVHDNLVYITVGTGIGIGLVVNGRSVRGLVHPEGGHVLVPIRSED